MINKLQNNEQDVAKKIRSIFQDSYKVEAAILKADYFPPLERPIEGFLKTKTEFFGYSKNQELVAVVEIIHNDRYTHIRSLVVHPSVFRQGIAGKLMEFTLNNFNSKLFIVETGVDNEPACRLYKKFGFIEVKQWDTEYGIRKIKFELKK